MLNITEVRIKPINKGNFLCYASILLDNSLVIDGIELHDGKEKKQEKIVLIQLIMRQVSKF